MTRAVVFDCEGARPTEAERAFFKDADPWGFILFARHCETPDAVRAVVGDLRDAVGRDAPILIDQEGGRVARMKPPHFPAHPAPAAFGALWTIDRARAAEAARLNGFLLGRMTADLGVEFVCAPMLDIPHACANPQVIGDRAFSPNPEATIALGRAAMDGLLDGGAIPVMKHMPGHGRSAVDTHYDLFHVDASRADLEAVDFAPFRAIRDCPAGMTAHLVYDALDPSAPATLSRQVISETIRGAIGFSGLLFSDDLKMGALGGALGERAASAQQAGCDIVLCCNYPMADKIAAAAAVEPLIGDASERADRARQSRKAARASDLRADYARLKAMLAGTA